MLSQVWGRAAEVEVDEHKPRFLPKNCLQEGQGASTCGHHAQVFHFHFFLNVFCLKMVYSRDNLVSFSMYFKQTLKSAP